MHDPITACDHRFDHCFVAEVAIDDLFVWRRLTQIVDILKAQKVRHVAEALARHLTKPASRASDEKSFHEVRPVSLIRCARPYPPHSARTSKIRHFRRKVAGRHELCQ